MHYSTYDPYTTETYQVLAACNLWDPSSSDPACQSEGDEVYVNNGGDFGFWAICSCQDGEYMDVSVYDPSTIYRGNLTKTTVYTDAASPAGPISQTKQYDDTGNLVAESASCCELKTYVYDDPNTMEIDTQYAYPVIQSRGSSDPNSTIRNTSTAVFDFNTGLVKQSSDPNGRTSTSTYDASTLRPTVFTTSTGAYTQTTYDESGMTITDEVKDASNVTAGKTIRYLNGLGLTKRVDSIGPSNVTDIAETKYNQLAEIWKESRPYRSGDTVQWSEKFYDLQGRVTKIVEPDASETKAFYNETQRPDSASNLAGNTVRVMDAWGRERWGRYDALGRLVEVVEPKLDGDGLVFTAGSLVTNYTYDTLGRLTQSNQGGQLRKFNYDSLGRLTRQKLAEQTETLDDNGAYVGAGNQNAKWSMAAVYDSRSNITQRTDARGVKANYSYQINSGDDPLNRIQSVSYDLGGTHDASRPIPTAPTVTYEYMTTGDQDRLKKVTSAGISADDLAYDTEGRVTDQTKTLLTRTNYPMVTSYTYDTLSRIATMKLPAQYGLSGNPRKTVQYFYDSASRLTTLKYGSLLQGYTQYAGDIAYNASDQTTSINIGPSGANQVNEQYTFDEQTGLLTNQKAVDSHKTLLDLTYDYSRNNSVGTLNGKTGHLTKISNNLDHNMDREYKFDAVGRLTNAKGGVNSALWSQTYSYDRYGNRTSVAATGVAADNTTMPTDGIPNLAFNTANNQITTSNANGQFEYDLAGNQTRALSQDGTSWLRYEYDAANRLVNIKQDNGTTLIESQQFGVGKERIALTDSVSGLTTWYGDSVEYLESGGNGLLAWSKTCVYLGDSLLSTITKDGAGGEYTEYNHPDRLGTRLTTDQADGTSSEQAHLPFGKALDAESTITNNPKRFTSYERSSRTELDYAVNRTYDSKQGRFTQVDPMGMGSVSIASPQTLNLYAYCANDPINHLDPSGLGFFSFLKKLFKWILIAVAVIVAVALIVIGVGAVVFALGSAMPAWLGDALGSFIGGIGSMVSSFAGSALGVEIGASAGFGIFASVVDVGAITSSFIQTRHKKKRKKRVPFIKGGEFPADLLTIVNAIKRRVDDDLKNPDCAKAVGGAAKAKSAVVMDGDTINPAYKGSAGNAPTAARNASRDALDPTSNVMARSEIGGRAIYINHKIKILDDSRQETVYLHELHRLNGYGGGAEDDYEKITKACGTKNPLKY